MHKTFKFKHSQWPMSIYVSFQKRSKPLFLFPQMNKLSGISRTNGNHKLDSAPHVCLYLKQSVLFSDGELHCNRYFNLTLLCIVRYFLEQSHKKK